MVSKRRWVIFVVVLFVTLALDQGSKAWAHGLPTGVPQPVIDGYWDWELAYNPGAAFSSFVGGDVARVLLVLVAIAAIIAITVTALRTAPEQRLKRIALAVIAGGALGNLVDRFRDGAVTDFVRWRIHEHRWPIFNVADVALAVGVGLLLIEGVLSRRAQRAS